jgi:hypothetical protein
MGLCIPELGASEDGGPSSASGASVDPALGVEVKQINVSESCGFARQSVDISMSEIGSFHKTDGISNIRSYHRPIAEDRKPNLLWTLTL